MTCWESRYHHLLCLIIFYDAGVRQDECEEMTNF